MPISFYLQIKGYIFQTCFLYFSLFIAYKSIFVSISCLSTYISFYLFVNPDWCLSLSISLSIQINGYIFETCFLFFSLFFTYPHIFISISFLSTSISLYLFVNPVWCQYLSISKLKAISFKPVFFISVYLLHKHLYLFLSLVYPPIFLSTSLSIQIDAYLFLSLCQSKLTAISLKPVFFFSVYSLHIHLYLLLSLIYPPLFLYTSLSTHIDAHIFISLCQSKLTAMSFKPVFFLIQSIFCIYTYIYFYFFSIHLYFFIPLSIQIDAHFFLSHCQSKFTVVSFKPVFLFLLYSLHSREQLMHD